MQSVWKHFTNVATRRQICSSAVSHSVCQTHPKTDLCFQFFQKSVWKYSWRSVSAKPAETQHPRWSAGTRLNHVQICRKHYWSDLANSWLTDHVCLIQSVLVVWSVESSIITIRSWFTHWEKCLPLNQEDPKCLLVNHNMKLLALETELCLFHEHYSKKTLH